MSTRDWETYARQRMTARGDVQAAWLDVINAATALGRLSSYTRAAHELDAALLGFRHAHNSRH
jgi:hypothetical protein